MIQLSTILSNLGSLCVEFLICVELRIGRPLDNNKDKGWRSAVHRNWSGGGGQPLSFPQILFLPVYESWLELSNFLKAIDSRGGRLSLPLIASRDHHPESVWGSV